MRTREGFAVDRLIQELAIQESGDFRQVDTNWRRYVD